MWNEAYDVQIDGGRGKCQYLPDAKCQRRNLQAGGFLFDLLTLFLRDNLCSDLCHLLLNVLSRERLLQTVHLKTDKVLDLCVWLNSCLTVSSSHLLQTGTFQLLRSGFLHIVQILKQYVIVL